MQAFWSPPSLSTKVLTVPSANSMLMRLPFLMVMGAPVVLVSVTPLSTTLALKLPSIENEPLSLCPVSTYEISSARSSCWLMLTSAPTAVTSRKRMALPATFTDATAPS